MCRVRRSDTPPDPPRGGAGSAHMLTLSLFNEFCLCVHGVYTKAWSHDYLSPNSYQLLIAPQLGMGPLTPSLSCWNVDCL